MIMATTPRSHADATLNVSVIALPNHMPTIDHARGRLPRSVSTAAMAVPDSIMPSTATGRSAADGSRTPRPTATMWPHDEKPVTPATATASMIPAVVNSAIRYLTNHPYMSDSSLLLPTVERRQPRDSRPGTTVTDGQTRVYVPCSSRMTSAPVSDSVYVSSPRVYVSTSARWRPSYAGATGPGTHSGQSSGVCWPGYSHRPYGSVSPPVTYSRSQCWQRGADSPMSNRTLATISTSSGETYIMPDTHS